MYEFICPECEATTTVDEMNPYFVLCVVCQRKGRNSVLVSADRYDAKKRQEELARRLYCRACGHIGLIEEFPFNGHPNDEHRERYCHHCYSHSGELVNMGEVLMCEKCDKVPAVPKGTWCAHCSSEFATLPMKGLPEKQWLSRF